MEKFNIFREGKKKTREEVAQDVLDKHDGRIELVGDYINNATKTLFHCNKCGNDWETTPSSILSGRGCPRCSGNEKKTRDQVAKEVLDKHEGRIELIGDYYGTNVKTLFRCNICGNEWETTPKGIIKGKGCPKCYDERRGETLKMSLEEVISKIRDVHGDKIKLIGNYTDTRTKTLFHCNICGNEWMTTPSSVFNSGHGCPRCAIEKNTLLRRKNNEEVIDDIKKVHGDSITMLGNYLGNKVKTLFHCNVCGNEWETRPNNILMGQGCPNCGKKKASGSRKLSREEVEKRISYASNGTIQMIGDYKGTMVKTLFKCNKCGHEWESKPNNILNGHGCIKCAGNEKKTTEQFKKEIYDKHNGDIELIGEYKDLKTKTFFHCNKCDYRWETAPIYVLTGNGCPRCSSSKGEKKILYWLEKNWSKDDWVAQKKFRDLRGTGNGLLSYDFYIPSNNLCIEFQGIQHYAPTKFHRNHNAEAQFLIQQEHDRRKRQYCEEHGMTLLEIRHDEMDMIDDILEKALKS